MWFFVLTSIYESTHYIDTEAHRDSAAYLKSFVLEEIFKLDVGVYMKEALAIMQNSGLCSSF